MYLCARVRTLRNLWPESFAPLSFSSSLGGVFLSPPSEPGRLG